MAFAKTGTKAYSNGTVMITLSTLITYHYGEKDYDGIYNTGRMISVQNGKEILNVPHAVKTTHDGTKTIFEYTFYDTPGKWLSMPIRDCIKTIELMEDGVRIITDHYGKSVTIYPDGGWM
jgi:hypothetical protein